jgi:hypothetical protein
MAATAPAPRDKLRIRLLNDAFRKTVPLNRVRVVITNGISPPPKHLQIEVLKRVQQFDQFNLANDPWGQHSMGVIDFDWSGYRGRIFWSIHRNGQRRPELAIFFAEY